MKLLYLAITYDCNLRCIYCYTRGGERKDYMSFSTAKRVIEKYYDDGIKVQFTGSEPLLNYKLIKRLAEKYHDVKFSVQTNATLLNTEKIEEMLKLGISIAVSIDGAPRINDKLRPYASGKGSTKDVLRAMMLIKSYDIDYGVTCVVTPFNERHLRKFIDTVYAFGAKSVSFDVVKPVGRGEKISQPNIAYIRDAINYSKACGYKLRFRNVLKEVLNLKCAAMQGKAVFIAPDGEEFFTCPTLASAGIRTEKCPYRSDDPLQRV